MSVLVKRHNFHLGESGGGRRMSDGFLQFPQPDTFWQIFPRFWQFGGFSKVLTIKSPGCTPGAVEEVEVVEVEKPGGKTGSSFATCCPAVPWWWWPLHAWEYRDGQRSNWSRIMNVTLPAACQTGQGRKGYKGEIRCGMLQIKNYFYFLSELIIVM